MSTAAEPPFRSSRYTTGAIVLHWTIALLILLLLASGFVMTDLLADGSQTQFNLYQLHKSLGITVVVLTVARILWRAFNPPPPEPASVGRLEGIASHAVHMTFYGLLLAVPLAGWLMITVSPVQIETVLFFQSLLPWPHLPGFGGLAAETKADLTHLMEWVHAVLAYAMGLLVTLHVAGAVKHHLDDRVFLRRMTPGGPGDGPRNSYGHATTAVATLAFAGAMVTAAFVARAPEADAVAGVSPDQVAVLTADAAGAPAPATADAPSGPAAAADDGGEPPLWAVDRDESALSFAVDLAGSEVSGRFETWEAEIRFDPDDLEASSIAVRIETPSAAMESDDITRTQLSGSDGFADEAHGVATFTADEIRAEGEGYVADGTLTIRGQSVPQSLPFQVEIDGDRANASGSLVLDRLDYGIGARNDAGGDMLAREVRVDVSVAATRGGAQDAEESAPAEPAPRWTMLPGESAVTFSFGFEGDPVDGAIEAFATDIRFDEDNLAGSSIYVTLDLESAIVEGSAVSLAQLRGSDGLASRSERMARFRADTIRATGENAFEADGTLELRGVNVPVTLPFTLFEVDGRAVAEGAVSLDRLAFGVGAENDPEGTTITPQVEVRVRVTAISEDAAPSFER